MEYRHLKADYKEKIKEAKEKSWNDFVATQLETDIWGIPYKIVTEKIRAPTLFSALKRQEGWRQKC